MGLFTKKRRNKHKSTIIYKILNGLTPEYLQFILPPLVQNTTNYNLMNSNNLRSIHADTNLFYNSFFPSIIRAWNDLSEEIKISPSVAAYKYRLNRDTHPPPKYINAGTRMGQILHARIRMECSALNSHLYRKNIVPSPSCSCGDFQSAYYYSNARNLYLPSNVNDLNTHPLLHGKPDVPDSDNERLFLQVQDFIMHSRRFI